MSMLPCISVRQPWAWMILTAGKDIENRTWSTKVRGRVLLHAAKGMTRDEWFGALLFANRACGVSRERLQDGCELDQLQRGGIVGSVEIVDCVDRSESPWFVGEYGFVLRDPRPLPFIPYKGALGFFGVPESVVTQ